MKLQMELELQMPEQTLISENGEIHQFDTIAGNLMSDSIESVQLCLNGVVTDTFIRMKEMRQVRLDFAW